MTLQEGRFRISAQLASGGQSVIYLAESRDSAEMPSGHQKEVVLKEFILPVYGDANALQKEQERFEHEAALLKKLAHKQIVHLEKVFVEDHRGYLVLEHIDGLSLARLIEKEGPQPPVKAVEQALQMCDIVRCLHGLVPPVVHRDFTPDNLMLTDEGTLKLIDFNVACESKFTTTATIVGKHAYLPPSNSEGVPAHKATSMLSVERCTTCSRLSSQSRSLPRIRKS